MFDSVVSHGMCFVPAGYQEKGGGAEEWCVGVWLLLCAFCDFELSVGFN